MKIIKELFKNEYSPFEVLGLSISTGLIADGNIGYGLLHAEESKTNSTKLGERINPDLV
jgi:hypothetical protein